MNKSNEVGFFIGFVDFESSLPKNQVLELLSSEMFGGIKLIEKDVDDDHNLGYLCLAKDFLGIQIDLCTNDKGGYTIELGTVGPPHPDIDGIASFDLLLKERIQGIGDFEFTDPKELL